MDRRVLFVGSSAPWFHQMASDIHVLETAWLCERVENLAEARPKVAATRFDAWVLDGRMADGAKQLDTLSDPGQRTICLVHCDLSDHSVLAQWDRPGLTLISDTIDAAGLVANVKRAERVRDWTADPAIKRLLPEIRRLPAVPRLHTQVTDHLQSPNGSMQTVACLISQDPVMSAKMLQMANSAFYGRACEVTDTAEAVMVLGAERVKSLILLAGVFSQYADGECPGFSPEPIWQHSLQVAILARAITFAETKDARTAETAFSAGLLHDVGKLILAGNLPKMYETVCRLHLNKKVSPWEAERIALGTTHAELGACLLGAWGLPLPILDAIAWHHEPGRSKESGFSLLAAVHVADVFAHGDLPAKSEEPVANTINLPFLMRAGLGNCRQRWREACGLPSRADEQSPDESFRQRREAREK